MDRIELIKQRLAPINDMIPTNLPLAKGRATAALDALGVSRNEYKGLYAENFLAALRQLLLEDPVDDWKVSGASNCLHLMDPETHMKLRFIKEFAFGGLPPAGKNLRRTQAWCQEPLSLFDQWDSNSRYPLDGTEIVVLWTETSDRFLCDAVQPLDAGSFPRRAKGKLILAMPIGVPADMFDKMTFDGGEAEERMVPLTNTIIRESNTLETK